MDTVCRPDDFVYFLHHAACVLVFTAPLYYGRGGKEIAVLCLLAESSIPFFNWALHLKVSRRPPRSESLSLAARVQCRRRAPPCTAPPPQRTK
jgi:hypothetical protein